MKRRLLITTLFLIACLLVALGQAEQCIPKPSNGYCRPPVVTPVSPVSPIYLPWVAGG